MDRLGLAFRVVGRLWSGVWVSASFLKKSPPSESVRVKARVMVMTPRRGSVRVRVWVSVSFRFNSRENVLGEEENCPGGECTGGECVGGKMSRGNVLHWNKVG